MWAQYFEQLINGLVQGGIYALIAVGYTMVYGIIQLINFAHGEIYMFGAYFGLILITVFKIPFWFALPLAMVLCALLGMLIDYVAYRPLRNAPRLSALITAIGISIALQNLAQIFWTAEPQVYLTDSLPSLLVSGLSDTGEVINVIPLPGGGTLPYRDVFILLIAVALMIILNLLIYYTRIGKAMRACAQNATAANLMGINANRVILATFAVGSALGAVAGVMVGLSENVTPTMGYHKGVAAFAAAVLGGIGSVTGAIVGGLIIGIAETFGADLASEYRIAFAYIIMILVILIRPTGLFGKATSKRA